FAVEPFYKGIRYMMMDIRHDIFEMVPDCSCSNDYRVEPGMGGPEIPLLEELSSPCFTRIIPEMTQIFLDCPRPRYIEISILKTPKFRYSPRWYIFGIPEPKVLDSVQKLIALLFEAFMFFFSDCIHCVGHMAHYMEAVKNDLTFPLRNVIPGCRDKRIPHIH